MKEIRKGNDIVVTWSLKREGEPFVLEGLSLTLYLKSMYDKKQLSDYSVSGNKIIWTFYGKDQTHTGNHSLELVVNKDEKGMMTTDACNFVRLVSCSCRTSNGWDDCGIKTEVVDIESEVEYGGSIIVVDKVLSPDSENAIANNAVYREFGKYTKTEELSNLLSNKVDKESGKGLSTEDFTTALKNRLNSLSNYDDKELSEAVATLRKDLDNLVSGDTTTAIKTFNEIIAFLDGIQDTESLDSIIASIEQQIVGKQDKLVSGTNIKTINGKSILGEGNIEIEGGEGSYDDTAIKEQLTELSAEVGMTDLKNISLKSGFNFFDIEIVAGREYIVENKSNSRINIYTSNEKKSDFNYIEDLGGVSADTTMVVTPMLSAKVLKLYAPTEASDVTFVTKQGNAYLRIQADLLDKSIGEMIADLEGTKTEVSKNTAKISEIENTIGENIDLDSAERIGALIEQYQSDMFWQQKANTSALVIPVKKGDKYTIVGSGVKSYYALTDKLDYSESYKAISLVDSIGGAINANTTIEIVCPSDAYLIVSEIDNKGENRLPSAISKYLGNIKTAIDEGLKELSSEIDVKIGQNNASVQQSLNGLSAEIAKKITNPSVGADGTVLMSLGNGEVKWANVLPKSGVFYGYFATSAALPSAGEIGYAYVGEKAPFAIYNYNGSAWQNSGITTYDEDYKRINVRDFGAIGDGVTNDEDAIRAAFAYAVENLPCEVYFPKGDYGILNGGFPVKIPNGKGGLRISGDGGNLSRIVYLPDFEMTTGEGWYAIRVQPTTTPTNEDGYIHDISIVNMGVYDTDAWNHALNPDLSSGDKEETHGFDIQYAIRARVEGCFIDSVGDECIDIYSCIDTIVTNNITHNSPAAGAAGGAISIGDGSYNVIVSNNIVRGNITTKENFGIAIESLKIPVSRVVIANNTISSLSGTGVKLSTPNDGASISDVSIVGNIVNGCTYGISDEGNYEKKNITIISNVLSDITHTAIYLSKQGNNILIDGCVIDSCQYAMWLNTHTIISNCTISNIYGYVAMVSSDEAIFDNCKIDNVCQDTTSWVIYIYGDEPIVSVRNCSITNIHSSRGLQKMKNVVNTDIYFTASGDAVSGVAITEKVVGVSTNGRISIGKNYAMVRDVSIVSENIGSNAITIAANVIGASVLGCYVNINNYSAIKENSGCDKNLICNNVTNMSVVKVGENSIVQNNIQL